MDIEIEYQVKAVGKALSKIHVDSKIEASSSSSDSDENLDDLLNYMKNINRKLNKLHEYVGPKLTKKERERMGLDGEYGGITGTLSVASFHRIIQVLSHGRLLQQQRSSSLSAGEELGSDSENELIQDMGSEGGYKVPDWVLKSGESVFCDIGCGTGRPTLYMAGLNIKASVGFDIDPMQVQNGQCGISMVKDDCKCLIKPLLFHGDVMRIKSLDGVTHAFAFMGYSEIIMDTAYLVANSRTMEVFVAVVLHLGDLRKCGLLSTSSRAGMQEEDGDIVPISGMKMAGGTTLTAYVIPMTQTRKKRVLKLYKMYQSQSENMKESKPERNDDPFGVIQKILMKSEHQSYMIDEERRALETRHELKTSKTRRQQKKQ